jgi:hypothetical protein
MKTKTLALSAFLSMGLFVACGGDDKRDRDDTMNPDDGSGGSSGSGGSGGSTATGGSGGRGGSGGSSSTGGSGGGSSTGGTGGGSGTGGSGGSSTGGSGGSSTGGSGGSGTGGTGGSGTGGSGGSRDGGVDGGRTDGGGGGGNASFAAVRMLIQMRCGTGNNNCHSGNSTHTVLTNDAGLHQRLVNMMGKCRANPLVTPNDPAKSLIVQKVKGSVMNCGSRMPKDCSPDSQSNPCLNETQIETIENWIKAGALAQ